MNTVELQYLSGIEGEVDSLESLISFTPHLPAYTASISLGIRGTVHEVLFKLGSFTFNNIVHLVSNNTL